MGLKEFFRKIHLAQILTACLVLLASIAKSGKILDTDIFWQARAGIDWFSNYKIIDIDHWSYLPVGNWIPNSWGWNIVLGLLYKCSPDFGLFLGGTLLNLFLFTLLIYLARKMDAEWESINLCLIFIIIFALPIFAIRPAYFSGLIAFVILIFTDKIIDLIKRFPIKTNFVFLFLNIAMVNFHYSWPAFLLAALLGMIYFFLSIHNNTSINYNNYIIFLVVAIGGLVLNPIGVNLIDHIYYTVVISKNTIYEWQSIGKDPIYFISLSLALLPIWFLRFNSQLKTWIGAVIVFSLMSLYAIRFVPWALIFSFPLLVLFFNKIPQNLLWQNGKKLSINLITFILVLFLIPFSYEGIRFHGRTINEEIIKKIATKLSIICLSTFFR